MCLTTNSPSLIGRKVGVYGERGTMLEESEQESMREMDFMDICGYEYQWSENT